MAVVAPTFAKLRGPSGGIDAMVITWAAMGDSDTATPVQAPLPYIDKSCQVEGTFSGATMVLQGSNDATTSANGNYETLNDPGGNAISLTTKGLKQVTEATAWIKPATSGGTGSSLTVTVLARRALR